MKRMKSLMLIMLVMFLMTACVDKKRNNLDPIEINFIQSKDEIKKILLFEGNASRGSKYIIIKDDNVIKATQVLLQGANNEENEMEISSKHMEDILTILDNHNVGEWNGFDDSIASEGGSGFEVEIILGNEQRIHVHGYNVFPEGFMKFETEMFPYLEALFK